jgi:hypothetical protein
MSTKPNTSRQRRRSNGFIVTTAGALLGFISCVMALLNPFPELYHLILYGATSLSIVLVFAGLYLILE